MDANPSYPLVPLPPQHGALVPVSTAVVCDDSDGEYDARAEAFALLWRCFCRLALFFWLAVVLLRRLRHLSVELRWQANYWRAQHRRAVQREAELAEQVQLLHGEIRELKRRLFGRKSETSSATKPAANGKTTPDNKRRSRGQQPGSKGHGRRRHDHLPTRHEDCTLPDDQCCCPDCGQPFEEIPGSAAGDILEVDVRAHRRRYHRKRYRRCCTCPGQPLVVTAPPPAKLIAKSAIGISLWAMILQHKFEFYQPLHRVLAELRSHGLDLAAGTITDGLQKLVPLFEPLYQLLSEHNRGADHWWCDETRWYVFARVPHKANFTWQLWVFASAESIVFVLDPTRSHDVPEKHFGADAQGIANVDRYSAYKAMAQVKAGKITLAFCWAHVRRDFLEVLTGWSELTDWAWSWLEDIGTLYHVNDQRLAVRDEPTAYAQAEQRLRQHIEHMRQRRDQELSQPKLRQPQRKALHSLQEHWKGLTVFVDHPEVPMDNNEAERRERGPVVARKNFYGSGALWSGRLAAMLFSLFQTLKLWNVNVAQWLTAYLSDCAHAGGRPPPDLQCYLPWNMTRNERQSPRTQPPAPGLPAA
ncbi:MAG: IS66 family transposase [Anaerolineales bacterium]